MHRKRWEHHQGQDKWPQPPRMSWRHERREFQRRWREEWEHAPELPPWPTEWRRKRGHLFFRFGRAFGCMSILILGGMAAFAFLLSHWFEGGGRMGAMLWMGGCSLALLLPLLAGAVAWRVFQGVATPLSDVMAATDAVAEGDLSVRVPAPKHGSNEFGRLARSFNRMIAELERSDQLRRNLTADVAHELRTPLHIIQGNLEGVLDGVYQADTEHINATLEETRALARLVDDLRTLSLAETGQLPLVLEKVDLAELLTDVQTSFSGQAEAKEITLEVEIQGQADELSITGDIGRLDQVLSNLLSNAIRHTPAGGTVVLRAKALEEGVRITVCDTGVGIPAEDLPFIFDRFWRGDRSRSHAKGAGSGLGLAITRQLVQAHNGRITAESKEGQGTQFTIDLPKVLVKK